MLPISRHLYLFPISPKPGHLSLLSVCSFVFADIFYINTKIIYNSADGLVYPSKLSGDVLCDTLRLVWCVCVRPPLCAPPMVSRYNLRTDFKFCTVVWYHKIQIKFELQVWSDNWFKSCDSLKTEHMWNVAGYEDPRQTVFNMLHCDELLIKYN